jgi:hypothetical protein
LVGSALGFYTGSLEPVFFDFCLCVTIYNMRRILISGASISAGSGLIAEKHNPNLFVNRLSTEVLHCTTNSIDNISISGIDNKRIFTDTALNLITGNYSHALVCWQSIPRINLDIGLEKYSTTTPIISPEKQTHDINLFAKQRVSGKKITDIKQYLMRYHNLHWEILDLVKYINILKDIACAHSTCLTFINHIMPWEKNMYFDRVDWTVPLELDPFSTSILQSEFRDDNEVQELYSLIHDQYESAGGINPRLWLNLYNPLRDIQIDNVSSTDSHPGVMSQEIFVKYLTPLLKNKINEIM